MLEFKNVSVSIGKKNILDDISVSFEKGKITTIVGPNGCGKTTLLQTLIGIGDVVSGEILLEGDSFLKMPLRERAKKISFLPQIRERIPNMSVKGFIEHGRFPYSGFSRKLSGEDVNAVNKAMETTGVTQYKDMLITELSGGVRQRVYLAMQLAQECPYIILDEPMTFLDFAGQREMLGIIKSLNNNGQAVIMVLHDQNQALQISDKIVIMQERKIIMSGCSNDCLQSNVIEKVFGCRLESIEIDGRINYVVV